jgi:hypothetical protein
MAAASPDAPLVLAALICEQVLEERDGVLSATRIIDRLLVSRPVSREVAGVQQSVFFSYLAVLKRGSATFATREHEARLRVRFPSNQSQELTHDPIRVVWPEGDAEDAGINLRVRVRISLPDDGLYWIDLRFDGHLVASTPLRVLFGPPAEVTGS